MELAKNSFAQFSICKPNLEHNYNYFRHKLKDTTKLMVLVKANSYGHGAVEFASVMESFGADYFGVAHPVEGVELREGGITTPIIILTAGTDYFSEIIEYKLEPSIPDIETLSAFESFLINNNIEEYPIHLNVDTGMHRLGFYEQDIIPLINFLKESRRVRVISIFSHLAAADDHNHDNFTLEQIGLLKKYSQQIIDIIGYKPMLHILNSAGIERFTQHQFDMVRVGIGIYGISAIDQALLKPAAHFTCKIIQIKNLTPKDGTIGYSRNGKIYRDTKIATIPLGYADGINRHLGGGNAKFMVNGQLAPTIGNICMDMCMIDITGIEAKIGDTVTIFGENPTARDLAKILGTIPYEIFTSVSRRVRRISLFKNKNGCKT